MKRWKFQLGIFCLISGKLLRQSPKISKIKISNFMDSRQLWGKTLSFPSDRKAIAVLRQPLTQRYCSPASHTHMRQFESRPAVQALCASIMALASIPPRLSSIRYCRRVIRPGVRISCAGTPLGRGDALFRSSTSRACLNYRHVYK